MEERGISRVRTDQNDPIHLFVQLDVLQEPRAVKHRLDTILDPVDLDTLDEEAIRTLEPNELLDGYVAIYVQLPDLVRQVVSS